MMHGQKNIKLKKFMLSCFSTGACSAEHPETNINYVYKNNVLSTSRTYKKK